MEWEEESGEIKRRGENTEREHGKRRETEEEEGRRIDRKNTEKKKMGDGQKRMAG